MEDMTKSDSAAAQTVKPESRLTEKGQRTRSRLIDAARVVFERDGYVDARVADIVKEARVAHGTFYLYFSSKEDIFATAAKARQEAIHEVARTGFESSTMSTYEAVEAANRFYIEDWAKHYRFMQAWWVAAGLHDDIARLLDQQIDIEIARNERALRRLQAAGQVAADVDPAYAARVLSCMVMQFCMRTFRDGPDGVDIGTAVRTVTDIWTRGVGLETSAPNRA